MTDPGYDAVATQLAAMRERLLRDAAATGVPEPTLTAAIDDISAEYAVAPVKSFVAVLVEREVRARLQLHSATPTDTD